MQRLKKLLHVTALAGSANDLYLFCSVKTILKLSDEEPVPGSVRVH